MKVSEINNLSDDAFMKVFANVVECFPKVASELFMKIPFHNLASLLQEAQLTIDALTQAEKVKILQLHPDLAGKLADEGKLTNESTNEQKSAGLDKISIESKLEMSNLNEEYKKKFGFPFVICARENKIDTILAGLRIRLSNSREDEIRTGIIEVKKICKLRILDIVDNKQLIK